MKADYKNWVPKGMCYGFCAGFAALTAAAILLGVLGRGTLCTVLCVICAIGAAALLGVTGWCFYARSQFSYDGRRKLSKAIVEGTARYVHLPDGGVGLDVGCGSGALTIACARRNPGARMVGCDRWGAEYKSFSQKVCEQNARAEGALNTSFQKGDATRLPFADESFDAVTSNYVYHNISGQDRQEVLLETLRVLKKGGCFAIHDLMEPARYGDMNAFCEKLKGMGYQKVELIDTTDGMFMSRGEAKRLFLAGSTLLTGVK